MLARAVSATVSRAGRTRWVASQRGAHTGIVKWYNIPKGFGFVLPDGMRQDAFVHNSEINSDGFRYLKEGERVEFELEDSAKGLVAKNVSAVGGTPLDQTPRSADPDA